MVLACRNTRDVGFVVKPGTFESEEHCTTDHKYTGCVGFMVLAVEICGKH
ncbi:MAG: hypothetical protein GY820_10460 [Gammaproteobacteria bacterium]|nr:hypothetical protein [Gammaproteobacteria bacterium]